MAKFLQRAIKHPGRIKKALGVPQGESIPASKMGRLRALASSDNKSLAGAARLAIRLKGGEFKK